MNRQTTLPVVILLLLSAASMLAQSNRAAYPLTAHIVGIESGHRPSGAWACHYELRIDGRSYDTIHNGSHCDKRIAIGADFPAQIVSKRGNGVVSLLLNDKNLSLEIVGTHE